MLEAMPVQKLAVGGRAIVRVLPQPIYDTECAKNAVAQAQFNFFQNGLGKADASTAIASKTYRDTNLQGGNGQLGKPYEFDLYSFNLKLSGVAAAFLLQAEFSTVVNDGYFEFKLGNRTYLDLPTADLPSGTAPDGVGTTTADTKIFLHNGVAHRSNAWKFTVGKYLVHIRSNEPFSGQIVLATALTAAAITRLQLYMNGLMYNAI